MLILINNKFVPKKEAKISILSEAFMYGYGVFETLRTYGNREVFKAKEHIDRLFASAKKINLKIKYSKGEILKMLKKITQKSPYKTQRIKIIAIKEKIIITSIHLKKDKNVYKGVACKTIQCMRSFPEVKAISYLSSYLSHEQAAQKGFYEAILIDKKGEVYEGAYSNIFWFEENTLCTRKTDVLPGITAQTVIEISPFKVKFKKISLSTLLKKSEIFLTQTTKGIVPITKINNKKIGTGKPGKKTKRLIKSFSQQNS